MSFSMKCKVTLDTKGIINAAEKGSFKSLDHAAAAIRLTARRSIRESLKPSKPGRPPHTRGTRRPLKNAIKYAVDAVKISALIGPDGGDIADIGHAHEFGGTYRGQQYAPRPFMGPAFEKNKSKLPAMWANSIK